MAIPHPVTGQSLTLSRFPSDLSGFERKGEKFVTRDPKFRVLGKEVKKSQVDQVAGKVSLFLTVSDFLQGVVKTTHAFVDWCRKKISTVKELKFSRIYSIAGLPLTFLGSFINLYSMAEDVASIRDASKKRDYERLRERTLSLTSTSASLSSTWVSTAITIIQLQGLKVSAQLMAATTPLGLVAYSFYLLIQGLSMRRLGRALSGMSQIFKVETKEDKHAEKVSRVITAVEKLANLVQATREDEAKAGMKLKDENYDSRFFKLAEKKVRLIVERKERKLQRRVGSNMAILIKKEAPSLLKQLYSEKLSERHDAYIKAEKLLTHYKASIYKNMVLRVVKVVGSVLGIVGGMVVITNPIGAGIFAGSLMISSAAIMLYAWYGEQNWKASLFDKGLRVKSFKIHDVPITSARDLINYELMQSWKESSRRRDNKMYALCMQARKARVA